MNRKKHRLLPAIAPMLLALSFLTSGCVEPLDPSKRGSIDPNAVSLPIRLYIPGAMPATKAGSGDVAGVSPESQVYRVQVWMFDHQAADERTGDTKTAVAYAEADLTGNSENMGQYDQSGYYATWESDKIFRLPLMIPGYVLERSADNMKFDFYVLANAPSIGITAGRETTRGALKALTFGKTTSADYFGTTAGSVKTGTTPSNALGTSGPGLPISGFFNKTRNDNGTTGDATGVDLSFLKPETLKTLDQDQITAKSPVVQLERAVSKVRFVVAKSDGMPGVQVTKIEINGELIPNQTYLFPREDGSQTAPAANDPAAYTGSGVVTLAGTNGAPLISNDDILGVADPEALRSDSELISDGQTLAPANMTAQQYEDFLTAAIGEKISTQRYVYLRESGKPIKGKIYYKLNDSDTERSAEFSMPDPVTEVTNFHRNHSWNVYAYFKGGYLLRIWTEVLPWELKDETTSFSSQIQCSNVSISGAVENTAAYMAAHDGSSNHDLDNYTTGDVPSTEDANYYSRYYQVRRLDMNGQGYFEIKFTPAAPFGGYWMLEPVFIGEGSSDKFDIEVQGVVGGESQELLGQIMKTEVVIHIKPKNYNYATDENSYAMILKSYFSPSRNFEPAYSADSEFQDVHRDGRFSYWRFTLTHGDY